MQDLSKTDLTELIERINKPADHISCLQDARLALNHGHVDLAAQAVNKVILKMLGSLILKGIKLPKEFLQNLNELCDLIPGISHLKGILKAEGLHIEDERSLEA